MPVSQRDFAVTELGIDFNAWISLTRETPLYHLRLNEYFKLFKYVEYMSISPLFGLMSAPFTQKIIAQF